MNQPIFEKDASPWPVGTDSFFQPRRAAFWVLAALIVNGLFYTLHLFFMGVRVVPVTALLGLVVWGVYTLVFVQVFRTLDLLEQHPPEAFVLAFAWGGMGAVYFSAPANIAIQSLCAKLVSPEFVAVWGPAVAGPITEEFLKLAGVVLLVLVARNQFQTYLSVLIVGAMTGLGFQVTENLVHTVNASMHFPLENQVAPVFINLLTRGLLSGLWSHAAYTTIASFGIAWFLLHPEKRLPVRIGVAFLCFALAWAMHFVWNSPFLEDLFDGGYGEMAVLLMVKGIPVLIAAGLFWRMAARENGTYLHALAAYFVPERELIQDDEWVRLGAPMQRYKVRAPAEDAAAARAAAAHPQGRHLRARRPDAAPRGGGAAAARAARTADRRAALSAAQPTTWIR